MLESIEFSAPLLELKNVEGDTPLHLAAKMKKFSLIKKITSHLHLNDSINNDGLNHLHIASLSGNTIMIDRLVRNGVSIDSQVNADARLWPGYTALHFAVDYGCVSSVYTLINHQANIFARNSINLTPLHLAFRRQNNSIIEGILSAHRWIIRENPIDEFGLTHFHIACTGDDDNIVSQFIQTVDDIDVNQSINLNSTLFSGYTPLHLAVQFGRLRTIKILLRNGANVNAVDSNGLTALHLACQLNVDKLNRLMKLAVRSLKPSVYCQDELKLFDFKDLPIEKWLLNYDTFDKIIKQLILFNSRINYQDHIGRTALFYSLEMNSTSLETFIESFDKKTSMIIRDWIYKKRKDFVKILLKYNANPNIRDFCDKMIMQNFISDKTLILNEHMARVIVLLIRHKWQIENEFKEHLFRCAIRNERYDIFKYLIDEGINVNCSDNDLNTPIHLTWNNNSNFIMNSLLANGAIMDAQNREGHTFLHLAMNKSNVNSLESIVENRLPIVEVHRIRCDRRTSNLISNLNNSKSNEIEYMDDFFKFSDLGHSTCHSYLLCDNSNINCQDSKGETPLHLACKNLNYQSIKILLAYGADINITNNQGFSPAKYIMEERSKYPIDYCFPAVRNHLNLLEIFGLPISEYNKMMLGEIIKTFGDINDHEEEFNQDFQANCKLELDQVLTEKINEHEVLYDVLFSHENHLARLTMDKVFVETLKSQEFEEVFPISSFLFKLQFRKGLIRRELIERTKTAMKLLFSNMRFPDSVILLIFIYLKNKDLINIMDSQNFNFKLRIVKRRNYNNIKFTMLECLKSV